MDSLALHRIIAVANVGQYDPALVGIALMIPVMACFYKASPSNKEKALKTLSHNEFAMLLGYKCYTSVSVLHRDSK